MPITGTVSVDVAAPPDRVWPWIADITRHAEWSPKAYQVELVSGDPGAVGSRYRSVGWVPPNEADHENDVEITDVVPMTRFALRATDSNGAFTNTFELEPVDQGTRVSYRLVFPEMKGINAIMARLLFPLVGMSDIRKRMQLLKQAVEAAG